MLTISLFESPYKPQATRVVTTWERLVRSIERPSLEVEHKDHLPGWSPAIYRNDWRASQNVESISALVLDYDSKPTLCSFEGAIECWKDFSGIIHTTYTHTNNTPRFRVILELSRGASKEEYSQAWKLAEDNAIVHGQVLDRSCKDASRFWYVPTKRPYYRTHTLTGSRIDVDKIPISDRVDLDPTKVVWEANPSDLMDRTERARGYIAAMPAAISGHGGHNATLRVATVLVRGFALPKDVALKLLKEYNERCQPTWCDRALEHKIDSALQYTEREVGYLLGANHEKLSRIH